MKEFSRDYSLRLKDEKSAESVEPPKVEPQGKPFRQAGRASVNKVGGVFSQYLFNVLPINRVLQKVWMC